MTGDHTIAAVDDVGPGSRARRLIFADRETRTTAQSVVKLLELDSGAHVTEESLTRAESQLARERALRLLGSRERSRADVADRLIADGYPSEIADGVCDRFVDLGLIDDDRFARMVARSRTRAGFGPRRIAEELRRHGVDEETARSALADETADPDSELSRQLARFDEPLEGRERERFIRKYVAKGFSLSAVLSALERHARECA